MSDYAELIQEKINKRRAQVSSYDKKQEDQSADKVDTGLSARELQLALDAIQSKVYNRTIYDMNNEDLVVSDESIVLPAFTVSDFDSFNEEIEGETVRYHILHSQNISIIKVDCWVYDKQEEITDKFKNIYSAFSGRGDALATIIRRTNKGCQFYFALRSSDKDRAKSGANAFIASIRGNFPGTKLDSVEYTNNFFGIEGAQSVAIVTGVGSEKSEKGISQGIEKLLNGIVPTHPEEDYTVVFLAESVSHDEMQKIRNGYETMASAIYPYSEYQESEGDSKTLTEGSTSSIANMKGVNRAIAKTNGTSLAINFSSNSSESRSEGEQSGNSQSENTQTSEQQGTNTGTQESISHQESTNTSTSVNTSKGTSVSENVTTGTQHTEGEGTNITAGINSSVNTSVTVGASATAGVNVGVAQASATVSTSATVGASVGSSLSTGQTTNFSDSFSESLSTGTSVSETESIGQTLGTAISKGLSSAKTSAVSYATSVAKGIAVATTNTLVKSVANTVGVSAGGSMGFQRSVTRTQGTSSSRTETNGINYCVSDTVTKNTTKNLKSYPVAETIKKIEKQIERIGEFEALGAWKQAIYVFGSGQQTYNVANFLKGLLQGDESFVENFVVNRWEENALTEDVQNIKKFVNHLSHPIMYRTLDMYAMMAENGIPLTKYEGEINQNQVGKMFLNVNTDTIEITSPTTFISSAELARTMSFPYKSVQGLSSINCVEFGRNIIYKNDLASKKLAANQKKQRNITVGKVNFMNSVDTNSVIGLEIGRAHV